MSSKSVKLLILWSVFLISTLFFSVALHNIDIVHNVHQFAQEMNRQVGGFVIDLKDYHDCNSVACHDYDTMYVNALAMLTFAYVLMSGTLLFLMVVRVD